MANDPQQFRVQDERFGSEPYAPQAPKKRSALATCLTGCLIAFVAMLVLGGVAAWWIWKNAASLTADFAKEAIQQTDLPEEEKIDIKLQIDRLAEASKAGKLSMPQLGEFLQELMKSPLMTTLAMSAVDKKYIEPSGLSDEEKAEARITVQRFMRGALDQKFNDAAMKKAMAPISEEKNGQTVLRDTVTDDELRAFLTNAKAEADAAGIPEEVETIDPSDEFKRIVDQTLGEGDAAAAPAVDAAEPAPPQEEEGVAPN